MRITPLDIRHKEFSRSMRGYKDLEVDEFLDEITEEFDRLFNENMDYNERLEKLADKISQYQNIEDTLQKTLISAQQQADELKQNAQKEADLILRDAELKARSIVNDSYAERQKVQRSVQALKQKHEDLRYQLRKIIETYANILDQDIDPFDELLDSDGEAASAAEGVSLSGMSDVASGERPAAESRAAMPEAAGGDAAMASASEMTAMMPALKDFGSSQARKDDSGDVEIDSGENKFQW